MAEQARPASGPTSSSRSSTVPKDVSAGSNPAFRALGLPNLRLRLPSRNWMIFLTIVGSWTGALLYDRRKKKQAQLKWCELVKHIARDPLPASSLARRITIYLTAPPGDSIRSAREHFAEYVKPVLVAAAMDWDVIEGRREGEVRAGLADKIRKYRRRHGEIAETTIEPDGQSALDALRLRTGVQDFQGAKGDLVIGRNTWKEYIRGLHEGWLGPLDTPVLASGQTSSLLNAPPSTSADGHGHDSSDPPSSTSLAPAEHDLASPATNSLGTADVDSKVAESQQPEQPKKSLIEPPYNSTDSYGSSSLPATMPQELQPSSPIAFPHILGFLNTPVRMYRFLNRRQLADDIGRQTAAAVLAAHRPYESTDRQGEQELVLLQEEREWHKKYLAKGGEASESVWSDPMALDDRVAERMRRFVLSAVDEERARQIGKGSSGIPGTPTEQSS